MDIGLTPFPSCLRPSEPLSSLLRTFVFPVGTCGVRMNYNWVSPRINP